MILSLSTLMPLVLQAVRSPREAAHTLLALGVLPGSIILKLDAATRQLLGKGLDERVTEGERLEFAPAISPAGKRRCVPGGTRSG